MKTILLFFGVNIISFFMIGSSIEGNSFGYVISYLLWFMFLRRILKRKK